MFVKRKSNMAGSNQLHKDLVGYAFLAPNLIGFLAFTLVPFIYSFYISFFKWDAITDMEFVGINNYVKLFKDSGFLISLKNTFYYTFVNVPMVMVCGMILALCVHNLPRGKSFFRTVYFMPNLVTVVSIAIVWQAFFHPTYSPFSMMLRAMGVSNPPKWVSDPLWAMPCIIGANAWQKFWKITLPSLSPTIFFATIIAVINSFKVFDQVSLLTQGGPGRSTNVLVYYIYQQGFTYYRFGTASAAAYVLFALILIVTVVQFRGQKKWAA